MITVLMVAILGEIIVVRLPYKLGIKALWGQPCGLRLGVVMWGVVVWKLIGLAVVGYFIWGALT